MPALDGGGAPPERHQCSCGLQHRRPSKQWGSVSAGTGHYGLCVKVTELANFGLNIVELGETMMCVASPRELCVESIRTCGQTNAITLINLDKLASFKEKGRRRCPAACPPNIERPRTGVSEDVAAPWPCGAANRAQGILRNE